MCRSGRSFALSAAQASSQWSTRCAKGCVNHSRSRADPPPPGPDLFSRLNLRAMNDECRHGPAVPITLVVARPADRKFNAR